MVFWDEDETQGYERSKKEQKKSFSIQSKFEEPFRFILIQASKQNIYIKKKKWSHLCVVYFFFTKPKYMSIKIYWANKILKSFGNKNLYKFYMYTGIERKKELNVTKILFFFLYNKIYWISGLLNFLSRCFSFWSFF